ncbi:MAG: T9SS type A sorting domain-containing protein [Flavobacteriales bacterium]
MRQRITLALLCLPFLGSAQTYYYINSISVDPPAPATSDPVTITVHGDLSSTGAYIISSNAQVVGTSVQIDILAADPGGFTVLVPHEVVFSLGLLPANTYTIVMDSTLGVWDMAPLPEHLFIVTDAMAVRPIAQHDGILVTLDQGQLTVTATDGQALGTLQVFDASGRSVLSTRTAEPSFRIDLATSAQGNYMLHLAERGVVRHVAGL